MFLFSQYAGIAVGFWEALHGSVPGAVDVGVLYRGIFVVRILAIQALLAYAWPALRALNKRRAARGGA